MTMTPNWYIRPFGYDEPYAVFFQHRADRGRRLGAQLRAPNQGRKGPFQGRSRGGTLGPYFDPKSFRWNGSGTLRPKNGVKVLNLLPFQRNAWNPKSSNSEATI